MSTKYDPEVCKTICELVADVVSEWVNHPDEVEVNWEERENKKDEEDPFRIRFTISGNAKDAGLMIGFEGQNATAIRQIVRQVARKNGFKAEFEVEQPAGYVKEAKASGKGKSSNKSKAA